MKWRWVMHALANPKDLWETAGYYTWEEVNKFECARPVARIDPDPIKNPKAGMLGTVYNGQQLYINRSIP